jgi:hypothetical protein
MANYRGEIAQILNSPEWQKYMAEGRVQMFADDGWKGDAIWGLKSLQNQLGAVKEQDKMIGNYYELATGQKADDATIQKYVQYAGDPALLAAAIGKGAATGKPIGNFSEAVTSAVTDKLGRPPTEAELDYFGKQMESGNLDAYGLQEFLQGTTEYQTKYADTARQKLSGELGAIDDTYLAKIQKGLESRYADRKGASAFGSSLIQAGKDLATQRGGYLADIGYQSSLAGQQNMKSAYENQLANMYNRQQAATGLGTESRSRYYSNQDFSRQQAAQERLAQLNKPKSGSFLQNLVPGLITSGAQIFAAKAGQPQTSNYSMGGQNWRGTPWKD